MGVPGPPGKGVGAGAEGRRGPWSRARGRAACCREAPGTTGPGARMSGEQRGRGPGTRTDPETDRHPAALRQPQGHRQQAACCVNPALGLDRHKPTLQPAESVCVCTHVSDRQTDSPTAERGAGWDLQLRENGPELGWGRERQAGVGAPHVRSPAPAGVRDVPAAGKEQ